MATILQQFTFQKATRGSKHPWTEWLDGQIRQLDKTDFGDIQLGTVTMMAKDRAKKMGKKCRISVDKKAGTVTIQAYTPEPEESSTNGQAQEPTPAQKKKGGSK